MNTLTLAQLAAKWEAEAQAAAAQPEVAQHAARLQATVRANDAIWAGRD